ncbi:hypothetical protein EXIGLDRAFT_385585 [Exidia glandulosa HHB12029]|uniref:Uncharacterized protein n=1 Tax=Exidia glandulosa HHB12029 TaxID=1314781 RepID=A0A165BW19_EXIGL|nr:hypothetical protein EXIGLDRAFT_385585 [Exidia glandulosa HHB12029]
MLQSLKIRLHNAHDLIVQDPSSCPDDIFSGHAPQLRELNFPGTMWPLTPVPAFNCVSSIKTEYEDLTFPEPEVLFISCPALCDLVFRSYTVDETPRAVWDTCYGRCLRKLVIYGSSETSAVLNVTTADTEYVSFSATCASVTTFDHIFQHFPGDIQMQVRGGSGDVSVVLKDDIRTRKVRWVDDEVEELLVLSVFAPILSSITTLWLGRESILSIAHIALRFPNVVTLVIAPSCPYDSTCGVQPLSFPALRRLEVESSIFAAARLNGVHVHHLARFMGSVLGCLPRSALTLVFRGGAHLEGDPRAVRGYFREIIIL